MGTQNLSTENGTRVKKSEEPLGYKQTEVGVIPADWDVFLIGDAFDICNNLRLPLSAKVRKGMLGEYPYYGPTKIQDYLSEYRVEGEYALIGEDGDHFLDFENKPQTQYVTGKFNVNNHAHLVKGKIGTARWFYLYFRNRDISPYLSRQGAGRYKLNKASLNSMPCAVPPEPEQHAIGAALIDVDALLEKLDSLIAKKCDLKQAAMQQLLTGQTRLPGFEGEWELKRLADIAHIKTGSRNNEDKVQDGDYPFFVRSDFVERINSYSHDCEAILVPGEGRIGDIFHYINGRFDVHQRVYAITQFSPNISAKFVHLYMAMNFGAWAMQNTVKATVDSLRLPTFQSFELKLPPFKEEQTAIATVLSDMDAEIAALEHRRHKTRDLKQAMMQELLTGRTRLI
ncbi:restriction endonuclease subunit S [Pseudohongiella acticola]|uniref:restriction endonuclease subunit S n=1 Tax=Pseudohongiella acticola TaxID=1524254 RepID=UPI000AE62DDB|nr:restriction endonuclease subunit S [Pseudohongiella acticola]